MGPCPTCQEHGRGSDSEDGHDHGTDDPAALYIDTCVHLCPLCNHGRNIIPPLPNAAAPPMMQEIRQHQQSQPLAPTCSLANFEHLHRHWQQQEIQQQEIQQHQQSQPLAAASAEAAPNIGIAAAGRTTEVLGLVLQRGQGLVAVCDSNERKGLVAVRKSPS